MTASSYRIQQNQKASTIFKDMDQRPRIWRIGLLLVTIVPGVLLVLLGILGYQDARENGLRITQAQAMYMVSGFQHQIRQGKFAPTDIAEAMYAALQSEGVHRVALFNGVVPVSGAGAAIKPLNPGDFCHLKSRDPVEIRFVDDDLVHACIQLPKSGGRRGFGQFRQGRRAKRNLQRPDSPASTLMIEFEPTQARNMRDRAFQIMTVDIIAAVLLMGTAIVFWRLSVKQENLRLQLEKDEQLKLLGQMSAVLGHELKNTIASVKGHSQLLMEKLTGTPNEGNAALIEKDTLYLQTLTEQILDFARTGAMNREKVYLDDLAEAAVTFSDATNVHIDIRGTATSFSLDRHKMQQVLINLLNNAAQAGASEILLTISGERELQIMVTDNGTGMDKVECDKVFNPFFTTKARGTGLGLALSKRVVEAHGGTITVMSIPQKGATFTIHLPSAPAQAKEQE